MLPSSLHMFTLSALLSLVLPRHRGPLRFQGALRWPKPNFTSGSLEQATREEVRTLIIHCDTPALLGYPGRPRDSLSPTPSFPHEALCPGLKVLARGTSSVKGSGRRLSCEQMQGTQGEQSVSGSNGNKRFSYKMIPVLCKSQGKILAPLGPDK